MRSRSLIIVTTLLAVVGSACGSGSTRTDPSLAVASFFPLAATLRALDPALDVVDLTPPGAEPHDLELTTSEMDQILDARLVVVMGAGFQPAIERAARARAGAVLEVMDRLDAGSDPHVWLDPQLMRRVVTILAAGASRARRDHRSGIRTRARRLDAQLVGLDREYRRGLSRCQRRTIVTAHESFGRLARRYQLRPVPIVGISPDQEPDPQRLSDLIDVVRRQGVTTVFTESQVSPRVARSLANAAGVRTAVLDPIESPADARTFDDYLRAMRRNLAALRSALGCRGTG